GAVGGCGGGRCRSLANSVGGGGPPGRRGSVLLLATLGEMVGLTVCVPAGRRAGRACRSGPCTRRCPPHRPRCRMGGRRCVEEETRQSRRRGGGPIADRATR